MGELERDVKFNYQNIINLMEMDPFAEIIHRYNNKLAKLKAVFTEFKNQPQEIPEHALKIKNL
jgi:hypothetical protein